MYSSIIFQTFDSDISKTISKIEVFGKSFNEIFTLIKQRSVEIKDLKKSGVNPDEAKEQVGGLLSYVFKDEYKDGLVKEFESFMGEMNKTGKNAHELASELGSELNPAIRSFVESSSSGKITVEGFRKSIGNLSIVAKAGEVAMKGLTLAGNVLVSFLISQAIEGCIKLYRLSKDVAASANEVGSSFLSEKKSIESYEKQIAELYDTINDSSSSFEDVTNAMIIPASGSANNNLYNGGSITYDADTGVITVNSLYVKIVADIYYIVDYSLGNFSTKGMSGTLETVATRDRTTMSRNYVFNATSECSGVMLKMHSPANGASGGSIQVFGTKTGTNVYEKIDTVTAVDTDTLVPFSGYDHIKLVVTARHLGNVGHSYEAGTVTTYTFV